MKRIKVLFLAALLTVGLISIAPRVEAANWVWAWSTDYATIQIDASTCRWINGTLSFWDSWYYIDSAGRNKRINELQNAACRDGENVDYSNLRKVISHRVMYQAKDGTLYYKTLHITWYDIDILPTAKAGGFLDTDGICLLKCRSYDTSPKKVDAPTFKMFFAAFLSRS